MKSIGGLSLRTIISVCCYVILLTIALLLFPSSSKASEVNFTIEDAAQTIDGFGASSAFLANWIYEGIPTSRHQELFDSLFSVSNGIGLSLVRSRVSPILADNHESALVMQEAQSRGVTTFYSVPWSPPAHMKSNGSLTDGGSLLPEYYDDYAAYLTEYVTWLKNNYGIELNLLSIQNEPDLATWYESAIWSGPQLRDFIKTHLGPTLKTANPNTKIMVSEEFRFFHEMLASPSLQDAAALQYLGAISAHGYGYANFMDGFPTTKAKDLHIWQTENANLDDNDSSMTDGLRWAKSIHDFLTNPNTFVNAYFYWWLVSDYPSGVSLINWSDSDFVFHKRFYTFGHYSKFVRPGFIRLNTSPLKSGNVYLTAFKNPVTNKLVIVAVNDNQSAQTLNLNTTNYPGSYTPYLTTDSQNLSPQNSRTATSTLTYQLPPQSVVTFVPSGDSNPTPSPTPSPRPGDINLDGAVDGVDYGIFFMEWDKPIPPSDPRCDFNQDEVIDSLDYLTLYQNWDAL